MPELDSRHLGACAGILAGDICLILSAQILDNLTKNKNNTEFWKIYRQMQLEVSFGQNDDALGVGLENLKNLDENSIIQMLDLKSGRYSIQKPLLLGASLNQASKKTLDFLSQIGQNLGLVFQLTDDLLGVFGEEKTTGKSASSDIEEGKRTLLVWKTYQSASLEEKQELETIFAISKKTEKQIIWVKDLMQKYQILAYIQDFCENLLAEIRELLKPKNFSNLDSLNWLIDFEKQIISRTF
jgi:geranylgeranyl diphosphate synthase type I